jgi:uncharacterized protein (DUF486 family)
MRTIICLVISNCFMTFAWYGGLMRKNIADVALWKLILISWAVAFLEYCFMVPANNRFGPAEGFSAFQLKTIQEIISLTVFVLFAVFALQQPLRWNYLVAFAFIIAAAYFMFLPPVSN